MNKSKSLRDKISKKLRHSENEILQKLGQKIRTKKAKPTPEYKKYFKEFEFKKEDIKSKIDKNAKFKSKKVTNDFIIKDYKENVYDKIVNCLKKFAKIQIHAKEQYEVILSNEMKVFDNIIDENLKKRCKEEADKLDFTNKKVETTKRYKEANKALNEAYKNAGKEFSKDLKELNPEETYFSNKKFEDLFNTLKKQKEIVTEFYGNSNNTVTQQTIEDHHKKIDSAVEKEYNDIILGFNQYVNVLEKFKKKYKIEHDSTYKIKF